MEVLRRICDVCRHPTRPVKRYRVAEDDREAGTDRCTEHGAVFEAVLNPTDAPGTVAALPPVRGGRRPRVKTMEEIEAEKAATQR